MFFNCNKRGHLFFFLFLKIKIYHHFQGSITIFLKLKINSLGIMFQKIQQFQMKFLFSFFFLPRIAIIANVNVWKIFLV